MARATTDEQLTHTRLARERGPSGYHAPGDGTRKGMAAASVISGALGIVAGFIPGLWIVALALAAVALLTGIPTMRTGRDADGYRAARIGVVLGVAAAVLGLLNLAISFEAFDYFTTPSD